MSKKVSVIIPCYNQSEFLGEAIDSALSQTYSDVEVVVVNDASSDETEKIAGEYSEKYDNVKSVNLTENRGLPHARNAGIDACSGEYILPLDADDIIDKTYVEKAVKIIESDEKIGMVYCEAEFFGAKTGKWNLKKFDKTDFLFSNCIFCTALFRKSDWEKLGRYDDSMVNGWEDWNLWLSFIENGYVPYQIPEILFHYRRHKNGSMLDDTNKKNLLVIKQIINNHTNLYLSNDEVIKRIFMLPDSPGIMRIQAKQKKYKKLFNILSFVCIILGALLAVSVLFILWRCI